ncbi:MAG: microsomal dipeptidase-like Zn-dependent dipeptidase [Myxococcota bacterium]|jgi:microsomal dipeptidase-like Zn-dependent dipeptidase
MWQLALTLAHADPMEPLQIADSEAVEDAAAQVDLQEAWVDAQVSSTAQVRLPITLRSMGWGCACPDAFVGTSPNMFTTGPWLNLTYAADLTPPESPTEGLIIVAEGHFTNAITLLDLQPEGEVIPEWVYPLQGFEVTAWRDWQPGGEDDWLEVIGAPPEEVRVQIDWQAHPAMHIPWKMFGRGLTDRPLRRRSWRHQFRQTVSRPALEDSGVRLFLAAAMAAERARNPKQARRLILKQLRYVSDFVADHSDRFALATTPQEARELLASTDKMVIIHSIEGGEELLWEPGDAAFWAEQGVALLTLIHLRDREFGGAALLDGPTGRLVNPGGARQQRHGERRGLTAHGEQSIVALSEAGILIDYSHMTPEALDDALAVSAEHGIPPVLTHARLDTVFDGNFSVSPDQLVEIYRLGGVFSLGLSALDVQADHATAVAPEGLCWGTLEAWAWHHRQVQALLDASAATIFDDPTLTAETLTPQQRTQLSTGWSSDWNGWLSHSGPTHGRGGCAPAEDATLGIDRRGLAHPGLLGEHWQRVAETGTDLDSMLRSSERFLQLWEEALE